MNTRYIATLASILAISIIGAGTCYAAPECLACKRDHKRICNDECIDSTSPEEKASRDCLKTCIKEKCGSACPAKTEAKEKVSRCEKCKVKRASEVCEPRCETLPPEHQGTCIDTCQAVGCEKPCSNKKAA